MLFLKTTSVAAAIFRMRERVSDKNEFRSWRAQTPLSDENPFYGAPAFSKENIVRGAGADRDDRGRESGTFHLRSSTPAF